MSDSKIRSGNKGLIQVSDHIFILSPDLGSDVQAVVGAMNSRAPNLVKRFLELVEKTDVPIEDWDWNDPPPQVAAFLNRNLAGYSHASIAEMAPVWVSGDRIGWPSAWMLLDFTRYIGQECSSRVIDQNDVENCRDICRYAPSGLEDLHGRWLDFYDSLGATQNEKGSKSYVFDDKRFALPGTMMTGLGYYNCDSRDVVRHLQVMQRVGGWVGTLAGEFLDGCAAYAPNATKSLTCNKDGSPRKPRPNNKGQWKEISLLRSEKLPSSMTGRRSGESPSDVSRVFMLKEAASFDRRDFSLGKLLKRPTHRLGPREYLDELYHHCGQVGVTHYVSVGTARDEHRHRMCMPWTIDVVCDDRGPMLCPWTPFDVPDDLWKMTQDKFMSLWRDAGDDIALKWQALHALPFCALLKMSAVTTLPYLLYKAELRAGAPNGHWEYREQNKSLIRQMVKYLPNDFVLDECIGGVLVEDTPNLI